MRNKNSMSNLDVVRSYLAGTRPYAVFGYTPDKEETHKDGDIWVDKDGIEKIRVGSSIMSKKLYDAKEMTRKVCSVCKKDIYWGGTRYDDKFFNKTGKCYDCVIEEETNMRLNGTYEIYEKLKIIRNQKSFLIEMKQKIEESLEWLKNKSNKVEYLNEDGSVECWNDTSREEFTLGLNKDLKETNKSLVRCDNSINKLERQLDEKKSKR